MNYYIKATDDKFENDMAKLIKNLEGDWIANPKGIGQFVGSNKYLSFLYTGKSFTKVNMLISSKCIDNDRHYMMPVPIYEDKLSSDEHNSILSNFIEILKKLNIDVKAIDKIK